MTLIDVDSATCSHPVVHQVKTKKAEARAPLSPMFPLPCLIPYQESSPHVYPPVSLCLAMLPAGTRLGEGATRAEGRSVTFSFPGQLTSPRESSKDAIRTKDVCVRSALCRKEKAENKKGETTAAK